MQVDIDRGPELLLCMVSDSVVQWSIQHSPASEGETFENIVFEDDFVTLTSDTGREFVVSNNVYKQYGDLVELSTHSVLEFDHAGFVQREYEIKAPVLNKTMALRG